ncbi:tyrosine-type recombinase/integrase [Leucobacter ruminantium]|uniref:Tyrosine-type recombinase/integrase n=1 Tax=Leucobacter ruminantium TaxID=1289170 RepID=A0A939RYI3_9MICO|nr:tyrosine-type recombinase/integrase [Leucobacter ruminantium]MBO1804459.1 tyrosine-type recombinase/integrase [Leucobacter ruminantium]
MSRGGRPRTSIGTYGEIGLRRRGKKYVATTRFRDLDGVLRPVTATGVSERLAQAELKRRLVERPGYGTGGKLDHASSFTDLLALWQADLELQDLGEGTRDSYNKIVRLYLRPVFENYTLGEITTGRVEWFIKSERTYSYSRARQAKTILNLIFDFALRCDAVVRNPVEGTSRLKKPAKVPESLTWVQIVAIRHAAATWRTGKGLSGPRPDGQVRDLVELFLGCSLRTGEALAIRICDVYDGPTGMFIEVNGTVVERTGKGLLRQEHPKTHHSVRLLPVAEFAAEVVRRRLQGRENDDPEDTLFKNRRGGLMSMSNIRRTFREFLKLAELADRGISPRWFRRTGATIIARGISPDAAADFLGHGSKQITETYYITPDTKVDRSAADLLQRTVGGKAPDPSILAAPLTAAEAAMIERFEKADDEDEAREAA